MNSETIFKKALRNKSFLLTVGIIAIFSCILITDKYAINSLDMNNMDAEQLESLDYTQKGIYENNYGFIASGVTADITSYNELLLHGSFFVASSIVLNVVLIVKRNRKIDRDRELVSTGKSIDLYSLTHTEMEVYRIVKEYLSKNRFLEIEKIVPFINSRLIRDSSGLNSNGIYKILNDLANKQVIVNGSKYTKEDVLINENRVSMYNAIINNPGIHFMRLVTLLGMSKYLVKWHINMLLKFNFIRKKKIENRQIYFSSDLEPHKAEMLHFISSEKAQKILQFLSEKGDYYSKYQLIKNLRMHFNTLTKYLDKLEEYGYVFSLQLSNKKVYYT